MGFFDKFIKDSDSEVENKNSNNSFMYLNNLIKNGAKEVILDSDISLDNSEELIYPEGIKIDIDGLIIEGNGHTIDAKNKTRIFEITAKNVVIKNVTLINGFAEHGGAILNHEGSVSLVNCEFRDNVAGAGGAIINFSQVDLNECTFSNNAAKRNGGAINNQNSSILNATLCNFKNNSADKFAGVIANFADVTLNKCTFNDNFGNASGVIFNKENCVLDINDCEFKGNAAELHGGVFINFGNINLADSVFSNNAAKDNGGVINNQEGTMDIVNCEFRENSSQEDGGAIINFADANLMDCDFSNNVSKDAGGAISNQRGTLDIVRCEFKNNTAIQGGAILNWKDINLKDSFFCDNFAEHGNGGAIKNNLNSVLICENSQFQSNYCYDDGKSIYNISEDAKFIGCTFLNHSKHRDIVHNANRLSLIDCIFKDNTDMQFLVMNWENSKLEVSGGEFKDNLETFVCIYNGWDCSLSNTVFENNGNYDIMNDVNLYLYAPKFSKDNAVFNKDHLEVRKFSHSDVERFIENKHGGYVEEFEIPNEITFDFSYLNDLIENSDGVSLEEDISLENYEAIFFEGGIDLDRDNMIIEGNGHVIDGKNKTRIFNISGKNIILRNIIFKNGSLFNNFEDHTAGGGAVKISKNGSVIIEDCQFIDNVSQDDGGAILNNGILQSINNKFTNNSSKYNGGAILNNNIFCSANDTYEENKSKIAGAIYNNGQLTLRENSILSNNESSIFKEPIYNADSIQLQKPSRNFMFIANATIYNMHNAKLTDWESFSNLNDELISSNEISLQRDIKIQYNDIDSSDININNDLVIEGNGHVLDINDLIITFKINGDVLIKNITFKNANVFNSSLFEINGRIRFENVKFINNRISSNVSLINNNSNVVIKDSSFNNNSSKNRSLINNDGSLEIVGTEFINNCSESSGSVIYNRIDNVDNVLIKDSCFMANSSNDHGGAIYNNQNTRLEIDNVKFVKNHAKTNGGAICNQADATLKDCIFEGNHANGGGAIHNVWNSVLNLVNCEFRNNDSTMMGGAIGNWGHLMFDGGLFSNNSSEHGGAIYNQKEGILEGEGIEFNGNRDKSGAIFTEDYDALKLSGCSFNDNIPGELNIDHLQLLTRQG